MKKAILPVTAAVLLLLVILALAFATTSCNRSLLDTHFYYDYAYIALPNGQCVEGPVESWTDFAEGDQIQVTINGTTYLSDSPRIVLVKTK